MTIQEICEKHGITHVQLAKELNIPMRNMQLWVAGTYTPPEYVLELIARRETALEAQNMNIRDIMAHYGIIQTQLSDELNIPLRTIQQWAAGTRQMKPYIGCMIFAALRSNRKKKRKIKKE